MKAFTVWCSACLQATNLADHKKFCLKGVGRNWWPWSYGIPCDCPHSEVARVVARAKKDS